MNNTTSTGGPSFRDDLQERRSELRADLVVMMGQCAHLMLTRQKSPVNTRDAGMRADSSSVGMEATA